MSLPLDLKTTRRGPGFSAVKRPLMAGSVGVIERTNVALLADG
jgi:hypothetical protein